MDLRFLSPLFLIGLAAAAVPIAMHLFRRQAEPVVPFGTVRFLRRAPVEQARRRRLREWLLLALRTLALVLLALSFARPVPRGHACRAGRPGHGHRGGHVLQRVGAATGRAMHARWPAVRSTRRRADQRRRAARLRRARRGHSSRQRWTAASCARHSTVVTTGVRSTRVWSRGSDRRGRGDGGPGRTPRGRLGPPAERLDRGERHGGARRGSRWRPWMLARPPGTWRSCRSSGTQAGMVAIVRNARPRIGRDARHAGGGRTRPGRRARDDSRRERPLEVPFVLALPAAGAVRAEVTDSEGYAADNVRFAVLDARPRPRIVAHREPGTSAATVSTSSGRLPPPRGPMACASTG